MRCEVIPSSPMWHPGLSLPRGASRSDLSRRQRWLLVVYTADVRHFWLRLRCLVALTAPDTPSVLETPEFRFLLFQAFISYRRVAATVWDEDTRPTSPTTSRTFYFDAAAGNDTTGNGTSGSPYQTLAKLVTLQQGGSHSDTYYLKGTFDEQKITSLVGGTPGPSNWLVFKVWPGQTATLKGTTDGYHPFSLTNNNGYVWIEGLNFIPRTGVSVQMLSATGPLVMLSCTHENGKVTFSQASNSWIEKQVFTRTDSYVSNAGDTIEIVANTAGASDDVVLYDCDVSHNGHMGISITPSGSPVIYCDGLRIGFCRVSNRWSGGIALGFITNAIVEGCDLFEMARDDISGVGTKNALIVEGEDTVVRYCRIWDTQAQAILVQGNVFGGQEQSALRCHIYHNSIVGNYGPALMFVVRFVSHVENNIAENNLCWGNCLGSSTTTNENQGYFEGHEFDLWVNIWNADSTIVAEWKPGGSRSLNSNIIRSNFFGSTSTYALCYVALSGDGGTTTYTKAQAEAQFTATNFGSSGTNDANVFGTDPLLASVDADDDDFLFLTSASPARNVGRAISGVTSVGAPDIGFHEFEGGSGDASAVALMLAGD